MKISCSYALLLPLIIVSTLASGQENTRRLEHRVTDSTNTLTFQEWRSLEQMLKEFEDSTSTQIAVLIVHSVNGEDIEEYAERVFGEIKIGQANTNNGVLLVVAKDDRQMKIEVGYGLEGVLTDALSSDIIRNEILPHFRDENYFAGLVTGLDAIMRATAGEYKAEHTGREAPVASAGLVLIALGVLFFIFLPMMAARRRTIVGSGGHRYFSGWGYGGWPGSFGGGGGSFGGFGGGGGWSGGGGMSGGGGATGSW